jgi:transcriptional regulator with XRE-family HTH domain
MARQTLSLPFSGEAAREIRERSGYTLGTLAERCTELGYPVHRSYLGKIESGLNRPSPPLLKALAKALRVKVDALLDGPAERAS